MRVGRTRSLLLERALGRLGEVSSRSKLRPANVFECGDPRTVCVPRWIAGHCETIFAHHNETQVGVRSMRAFKKSIQSPLRLYLWRKFSLFTNVGGSNWACYCAIVLWGVATGKRSIVCCSDCAIGESLLLFGTTISHQTCNVTPNCTEYFYVTDSFDICIRGYYSTESSFSRYWITMLII